jgi:hypothetical protein
MNLCYQTINKQTHTQICKKAELATGNQSLFNQHICYNKIHTKIPATCFGLTAILREHTIDLS